MLLVNKKTRSKRHKIVCRTSEEWDSACRKGFKRGRVSIPWFVWNPVFVRQNYTCVKCGGKRRLHLDHIIPLSRGGTNHSSNLQVLCWLCNTRKGGRFVG